MVDLYKAVLKSTTVSVIRYSLRL